MAHRIPLTLPSLPTMGRARDLRARARLRVVGLLQHVPLLFKCFFITLLTLELSCLFIFSLFMINLP